MTRSGISQLVILIGKIPLMFVANANLPARTMAEFISLARANPGKFNYASPGAGSQTHLIVHTGEAS